MPYAVLAAIPANLSAWLAILAQAVPPRSTITFLELLVGAMVTDRGFVTEAILAIAPRRRWQAYYKWLEAGHWSWVAVSLGLCRLLVANFAPPIWYLIIDDTLVPRTSKKAPGVGTHFDHAKKPNRSQYIWGQGWVTLAAVIQADTMVKSWAVPLLSRLVRKGGNHGKLTTSRVLLRVVRGLFGKPRLLLDAWYMRASVINYALAEGMAVIGQVRKDLALYAPPDPRPAGKRGRTAKYGTKMIEPVVATLPETRSFMFIYGQGQTVRYRSAIVLAKFLHGRPVRAVWVRLEDDDGLPKPARLLICTDTSLSARQTIEAYALRWTIEPMFNSLKNGIGMKDVWQQTRQTLHRWVQILSTAFAITQMMAVHDPAIALQLAVIAPWRRERHPTAGMVKRGLANLFRNVSISAIWDRKRRKFGTAAGGLPAPHPLDIASAA
jgi:hypothetical protein